MRSYLLIVFIEKIIMKINNDFTGGFTGDSAKKSAVKFLHDCFGDSIDDCNFIRLSELDNLYGYLIC